jgi:hypothetical protein
MSFLINAIHGIDQKASKFWMRVHVEYDEHKKPNFCELFNESVVNDTSYHQQVLWMLISNRRKAFKWCD